jgi:predicted esterase
MGPNMTDRHITDHQDPHAGQPVLTAGARPVEARLAVILLHGRGASAGDILGLARELRLDDVAYLAPEAADSSWYPYSFLSPMERNEPGISSAMRLIERLVEEVGRQGLGPERVALMGFSQGACLSLEFAARHARRYAGVFALSGGLIGPPGTTWDEPGDFAGTPVFLGCSDVDAHVPRWRVDESAAVFTRMGAATDLRIYPGMGHLVNDDEIAAARAILAAATG